MLDRFVSLYEWGVRHFYMGGALGVDMWAGEILLRMREQPEFGGISLVVVLPFEGYDNDWDERSLRRMAALIQHSDETVVSGTADESKSSYRYRNYYMYGSCGSSPAVYDNDRSIRSGTGMTVHHARKKRYLLF